MIYAEGMKEFFVRVKIKGMYFYGQGRNQVEAITDLKEKYKKRFSDDSNIQMDMFRRLFIDGELTEHKLEV